MPRTPLRFQVLCVVFSLLGCAAPATRVSDAERPSAPASDAGVPDADVASSAQQDCTREERELQRLMKQGRLTEVSAQARSRAPTCPGIRFKAAALLANRDSFDEAAGLLMDELASPPTDRGTVELLGGLFPRLSPRVQDLVAALGASAEQALPVENIRLADTWLKKVICRGRQLDRLETGAADLPTPTYYSFECPPGSRHLVYFKLNSWGLRPNPDLVSTGLAVDRLLHELGPRFGIHSVEALREAVSQPLSVNRSTGWVLNWLKDYPTELPLWTELLHKDPNDLEASVEVSDLQRKLGDLQGALKTLDAVPMATVSLRDTRGGVRSTNSLFTERCRVLLQQRKLKEAEAACRTSVDHGAVKNAPYSFALVLYLQGQDEEASKYIQLSFVETNYNPRARFLQGLILRSLGKQDEAAKALKSVRYTYPLTASAEREPGRTREGWVRAIEEQEQEELAAELALCGHYYLDLQMSERSEACFSRAQALRPRNVAAERIVHQAEFAPEDAIQAAQTLLNQERHPVLLYAMAFAQQRAGHPMEALRWLDESFQGDPSSLDARALLTSVCKSLNQRDCLKLLHPGP